jgi:hypothetical protein
VIGDRTVAKKEAWYIGQRAESLAIMYLTRQNDLIISRQQDDYGLDFLVTIGKEGSYSGRLFGVTIKATVSASRIIQHDNTIKIPPNLKSFQFFTELPFPVCLFFFNLEDDRGYYKWILEPVVEEQSHQKLIFNQSNKFKNLTDEEIDKIISAVNRWYDSRKSALVSLHR